MKQSISKFIIILLCILFINLKECYCNNNNNNNNIIKQYPYQLGIRDTFMIAHSFHNHPAFGIAGGLHGATYTCDVNFNCIELNNDTSWVIDIGIASTILSNILKKYNYQNLDVLYNNKNILTTTEFMCKQIWLDLQNELIIQCPEFKGNICVKLWESHKAWASYTGEII